MNIFYAGKLDFKVIEKKCNDMTDEVREKAQEKLNRMIARISKFKTSGYQEIEEVVREDINSLTPEELVHKSIEDYEGMKAYEIKRDYAELEKNNPDQMESLYRRIVHDVKSTIFQKELEIAKEQYFLFNNMTEEQLGEFLTYYYNCELENALKNAREKLVVKTLDQRHKKSSVVDDKGLKQSALNTINKSIEEVESMGKIGTIERVALLNERQKTRKHDIVLSFLDAMSKSVMLNIGIGSVGGALAKLLETLGSPLSIGYTAGYWMTLAVAHTLMGIREFHKTDTYCIDEAKKLGIYDQMIKAEQAKTAYKAYVEKMKDEYGKKIKEENKEEVVEAPMERSNSRGL